MVKKIISLIIMITITMMMTSHVFAQDTVFIDDNFEASSTENWIDNTGRGIKSVEGDIWNKYMVLTHKDSSFYNFQARDIYSTGVLYCEFDIKFTSAAMQIQTRESRDISAQGFTMAGRLRKTADYLEYYSKGDFHIMYKADKKGWFTLSDISKWYTIKMALNVNTQKYSIYVIDRDTNDLLAQVENADFAGECNYINYFAFSSEDKLCIDNVRITNVDIENLYISGEVYPQIPNSGSVTYNYFAKAATKNNGTEIRTDVHWSLKTPKRGVSLDSNTGELKVTSWAEPGPILIYVEKDNLNFFNSTYLIDLEQ